MLETDHRVRVANSAAAASPRKRQDKSRDRIVAPPTRNNPPHNPPFKPFSHPLYSTRPHSIQTANISKYHSHSPWPTRTPPPPSTRRPSPPSSVKSRSKNTCRCVPTRKISRTGTSYVIQMPHRTPIHPPTLCQRHSGSGVADEEAERYNRRS